MLVIILRCWADDQSEACFASLSAASLPQKMGSEAIWWPRQWMMPTSVGILAAVKSWSTSGVLVVGEPLIDRSPCSFQMAACECMMWKVYLESVYMFALLLAARVRALLSAISFAFWEEVPKGRGWDNYIIQLCFFLWCWRGTAINIPSKVRVISRSWGNVGEVGHQVF